MGAPVPASDLPTGLSYGSLVRQPVPADDLPESTGPTKIGINAYADTLRQTLRDAPWWERNLAGFGSALENAVLGARQFVGDNDQRGIMEQSIIAQESPVGAVAGNVGMFALPGLNPALNTLRGSAALGGAIGLAQPVEGTTYQEMAPRKIGNAILGTVTGVATQAGANRIGSVLANRRAALAADASRNAPRDTTVRAAIEAGYVVPPSSINPSFANQVKESISGKIATAQVAANRNQAITDSLARRAVGLPDDTPLTSDAMQAIRRQAYQAGYEPVAAFGPVRTDDTYRKSMEGIIEKYRGASRSFPGAVEDDVLKLIEGRVTSSAVPERATHVDGMGNVLQGFKAPPQPPLRSLLGEIKRAGGISLSEADELGMSAKEAAKSFPGLFRKQGGMSADDLVEWMGQHEWVNQSSLQQADEFGTGGSLDLARDYVRSALAKETVVHPRDADAFFEWQDAMKAIDREGIKKVAIPGKDAERSGGMMVEQFDSGDAIKMVQLLRDKATESFRKGETGLGKARRDAARVIEDQIERAMLEAGEPAADALKGFRDARKLMAKAHTVEDAIIEGGGTVSARKLGQRVQAGKPMSGELKTAGEFANLFPRVTQPPTVVAGPAVHNLKAGLAAAMGGAGGLAAPPWGVVAGAVPFVVPPMVRAQMFSKGAQNALLPSYQLGTLPMITERALPSLPGVVTGNALSAFGQ